MSSNRKDKSKFKARLKRTYRFIIRNDEDLREINSYKFSLATIYWLIFGVITVLGLLFLSLLIYTPLKRLIPGYGDINNNVVFLNLNSDINELEKLLDEQITYTEALKNRLFKTENRVIKFDKKMTRNHNHDDDYIEELNKLPFLFPPVNGKISMKYLLKKDHYGIDIVCAKNTEVKTVTSGVVVNSGWDPETGNTISIQHPNNLLSIYKHNALLLKKTGDNVSSGEAIAIVGNSGEQSTGPHLHFELWHNGNPVNPELFISF